MATPSTRHVDSPMHGEVKPRWPWIIVAIGFFLPGIIGVCVRQYLVSIGKPVMPWSWVAQAFPSLVIFSLIWVLPYVLVALIAGRLMRRKVRYLGLTCGAFLGTAVAEILVFVDAWRNVEAVVLGFLVIPILVFGGTLLGGVLGFLTGWILERLRK
ncbi:MAG: hypothetical protein WB627_10835 [Candidatus Acidiferrum sp.]